MVETDELEPFDPAKARIKKQDAPKGRPIVFVDTETTGLDPAIHDLVEVAWAIDDGPITSAIVPHTLLKASVEALAINHYNERNLSDHSKWARTLVLEPFWAALDGATLAGANPAFDAAFIRAKWPKAPRWHHRLLDVEAYAAGALAWSHPRGLAETAQQLGIEVVPDHTAAADVEVARLVYQKCLAGE